LSPSKSASFAHPKLLSASRSPIAAPTSTVAAYPANVSLAWS
jgi:hypothetical protein